MSTPVDDLRVAFIAGTLGCGGAERQLLFMLKALRASGVTVHVFSLTRGEYYEELMHALGIPTHWTGPATHPLSRMRALRRQVGAFQPLVVQAAHFFVNLYAAAAARRARAVELGAVRSDGFLDIADSGRWGYPLLRVPRGLVVNSDAATRNLATLGVRREVMHHLPNVIDLAAFDRAFDGAAPAQTSPPVAMVVGRLTPVKRYERFLAALHAAREWVPRLRGVIVGDGPSRAALEAEARARGLLPDAVTFTGACDDVPAQLRGATMLVSCSDHEGFPNVLLEAMSARLPVITTPAGECAALIRDDVNGYVVPFVSDAPSRIAEAMVRIAQSPPLAHHLGEAGRELVERGYTADALGSRLLDVYHTAAWRQRRRRALAAVDRCLSKDRRDRARRPHRAASAAALTATAPLAETTRPRRASAV